MLQLTNTSACLIRDKLRNNWLNNKIKLSEITERLSDLDIPNWLQGEIIQMCEYRMYDRITCPVEQAMLKAVCYKIVKEIKN